VGEERDTTATRVGGVDEPVVASEELVEEAAAERIAGRQYDRGSDHDFEE